MIYIIFKFHVGVVVIILIIVVLRRKRIYQIVNGKQQHANTTENDKSSNTFDNPVYKLVGADTMYENPAFLVSSLYLYIYFPSLFAGKKLIHALPCLLKLTFITQSAAI